MSAFDDYFSEVRAFNNCTYVVTGKITKEEAIELFRIELGLEGRDVSPTNVHPDRVRYGYAPEYVEDHESLGACWYTGASGKGSMPVWVLAN